MRAAEHGIVGQRKLRVPLPIEITEEPRLPLGPPRMDFVGGRRDLGDCFPFGKVSGSALQDLEQRRAMPGLGFEGATVTALIVDFETSNTVPNPVPTLVTT